VGRLLLSGGEGGLRKTLKEGRGVFEKKRASSMLLIEKKVTRSSSKALRKKGGGISFVSGEGGKKLAGEGPGRNPC